MKLNSKHLVLPLLLITVGTACKHKDGSQLESEISGSAGNLPSDLGVGFDSETQVIKSQCVTGTPVWRGAQDSSIEYGQDLSFNDIIKSYGGGAKAGGNIAGFDVNGSASFASKNAANEFSSTITLVNKVSLKRLVLANPRLTKQGKAELIEDRARDTVRETCGNEFFNEIEYGAQIFVVAKFDFANAQDKLEFKGSASVSLLGIGELGGNISHLSDKVKKSGRVSISARQVGGNPEDLSSIMSTGVISCSLVDFERTCLPALSAIVQYASNDFRKSLASSPDPEVMYQKELEAGAVEEGEGVRTKRNPGNAKGWAEVNFITAKYADLKIDGARLVPEIDIPLTNVDIDRARTQVYDDFQVQLLDSERAATMLRDGTLSDIKRKRIKEIDLATTKNKENLAVVGKTCMTQPGKCLEAYSNYKSQQLQAYDSRQLSLGICLVKSDIDASSWILKGDAGKNLGTVVFNADGTLTGYTSEDEKSWKVEGCILRFYKDPATVSTVFSKVEESGDAMNGESTSGEMRSLVRSK